MKYNSERHKSGSTTWVNIEESIGAKSLNVCNYDGKMTVRRHVFLDISTMLLQ